jgi:helicase
MNLGDLSLPVPLVSYYDSKGIRSLYPPQVECIEKGLLQGKNLLVSIPTASGKTLVAEMAMHHHIALGGKCLYIVPLRALASEKHAEFSNKGAGVGIATGDFDRRDEYLGRNDIIVATSEKVDSLVRNRAPWLQRISLLIVDEVHLIGSDHRGVTLEMVITKLRSTNPSLQIIALSATIGNPRKLAGWLGAELVTSSWRPTDLRQGVFHNGTIEFHEGRRQVRAVTRNDDFNLCLDTIAEGGQCLVFVSSRRNAEGFAKRAAKGLKLESPELERYAATLEASAETDMDKVLSDCVRNGASFHHAGLRREQRTIIEEAFRNGHIKIISATPTLAAGLNLPARRVIIRDYLRFESGEGMVPIPVMEYHQMAGRAGRPHLDPYGEAVLIARDAASVPALFEWYIDAPPEEIHSHCRDETALCAHILSLIASGFAHSREDLAGFMKRTFYHYENPSGTGLERALGGVTAYLKTSGMISETGGILQATEFGFIVSQLYLDPRSAELIADTLPAARSFSDESLLHLLCSTPDMMSLYIRQRDLEYLVRYINSQGEDLWIPPSSRDDEAYFRAVKTSMLLLDWEHEVPEQTLCERYGVSPGDIFSTVDGVTWLLHATGRLARIFRPEFSGLISECEICVKNGIRRELLPLIRLRNIGRVRARRLYNNGITTPDRIRSAGIDRISSILGRGVAQLLFRDGSGLPGPERDHLPGITPSSHGKSGKPAQGYPSQKQEQGHALPAQRISPSGSPGAMMQLRSIPGIGPKKELALRSSNIRTIEDLKSAGEDRVAEIIGRKTARSVFSLLTSQKLHQEERQEKRPDGGNEVKNHQGSGRKRMDEGQRDIFAFSDEQQGGSGS